MPPSRRATRRRPGRGGPRCVRRADCTGRVGVVGFCTGGGFALLAATRGFDVAAPSDGMLPRNAERVLAGACPVVASYGRRDRALRGAARRLERVLTEHDVREYSTPGTRS